MGITLLGSPTLRELKTLNLYLDEMPTSCIAGDLTAKWTAPAGTTNADGLFYDWGNALDGINAALCFTNKMAENSEVVGRGGEAK